MAESDENSSFAALLQSHLQRSIYTYGQLALLSGVPKRTIINWLDGTVRRPRSWQSVVRVAAALQLTAAATDALLAAAELSGLARLQREPRGESELKLLARWKLPRANRVTKSRQLLRQYLRDLEPALTHLPSFFPRDATFTFEKLYQASRVRFLEGLTEVAQGTLPQETRSSPAWEEVRDRTRHVVILGQPGMGKTWLLRAETLRLARLAIAGQDAAKLESEPEPSSIPLLVRLPELAELLPEAASAKQTLTAIATLAARLTPHLPEKALRTVLLTHIEQHPAHVIMLLDALDEVPPRIGLRGRIRRALQQLALGTHARLWLTSRTLGYMRAPLAAELGDEVCEVELLPFATEKIMRVTRAWFNEQPEVSQRLHYILRQSSALVHQASIPLLLCLICILAHKNAAVLESSRHQLYDRVLRLLLEGLWRSYELQLPESRIYQKLRLLEVLAWHFATYRQSWWRQLPGEVLEPVVDAQPASERLWATWQQGWGQTYEGPLWELSEWDGVLVKGYIPADGAVSAVPYAFLHRTLHEHLVAQHLLHSYQEHGLDAEPVRFFLDERVGDPEWQEVLLLLIDQLTSDPSAEWIPLLERLSTSLLQSVPDPTGQIAVASARLTLVRAPLSTQAPAVQIVLRRLLTVMCDADVPAINRLQAGQLLAQVGDPRPEVMDIDAIEFVTVPAGPFLMGSDPTHDLHANEDEFPQHQRSLPSFAITRYPISNAQYEMFLDDVDALKNPDYWCEATAAERWRNGLVWRDIRSPDTEGNMAYVPSWTQRPSQSGWPTNLPNTVIAGISFYEARAFVRWLEDRWHKTGQLAPDERLDLPSEAEWEKAARGEDGRIYPWGNRFDGERLNWYGHLTLSPVTIGCFPNGASPYRVEEMLGNLWEWTRSVYAPYTSMDGKQSGNTDFNYVADAEAAIVQRGGSHYAPPKRVRAAHRLVAKPYTITATFRLVRLKIGCE